jgi:methionyl-tRNA synthetase
VARNNNDLVANWGNLVNRTLSFAYKHWDGLVPTPGELRPADKEFLAAVEAGFTSVGDLYGTVKLRAALGEAMRLSDLGNKYLATAGPWFEIKKDKQAAATTIYTALRAIDSLKVLLAPVLPYTCEALHTYLGYAQPLFGRPYTEDQPDALGVHTTLRYDPAPATDRKSVV